MAHGLMQQHAGPARTEHHFHLAGGRGLGPKLQNGRARGFVREVFGALVAAEEVQGHAATAA